MHVFVNVKGSYELCDCSHEAAHELDDYVTILVRLYPNAAAEILREIGYVVQSPQAAATTEIPLQGSDHA